MKRFWISLALMLFTAATAHAQDTQEDQSTKTKPAVSTAEAKADGKTPDIWPRTPADAKFYRLTFVAEELDSGKITNSRKYVSSLSTWRHYAPASIRTGNRVPVAQGPAQGSQFTYMDVGIDFQATLEGFDAGRLFLNITGDASDIDTTATVASESRPVIRQRKWGGLTVIDVGKPTVIFSSDDLTSKRTMQVEVTATEIH